MNRTLRHSLFLGLVLAFAAPLYAQELQELKGRIIGEKCFQHGKVGECYLRWAEPMGLWTEDGEFYPIDLSASDSVDQTRLDKGFGREVEAQGRIVDGERIELVQLTVLNPRGKREFFKG